MEQKVIEAILKISNEKKIPFSHLAAVVEVESGGKSHVIVNGIEEPLIRFEGHYFYRRLLGSERNKAVNLGLANPKAGAVKNPRSQTDRWNKLLNPAMKINENAALESTSWGIGQVMGANWKSLGFNSVQDLVQTARSRIEGQIDVMLRFIEHNDLLDELMRGDWLAFARAYNGPAQANSYARLLGNAVTKLERNLPNISTSSTTVTKTDPVHIGMIRMGVKGAKVREVQELLTRAGYPVDVDGEYGTATKKAVKKFQKDHKLEGIDGLVGPETWNALDAYRQTPDEKPGVQSITDLQETKKGIAGTVSGTVLAEAGQKVQDAADKLPTEGFISNISTILYVIGALFIIGSIVYVAYGYLKSKRTTT